MQFLIGLIGLVLLIVTSLRRWLLRRESPQKQAVDLPVELFQVGSAVIARSRDDAPGGSVIVMHGFVENFLYFTEHYADPNIQLIMLTSADYHLPINQPRFSTADWIKVPSQRPGTIAYDAAVLNQALEHLATGTQVRVHGHSRGGAVTLEAARQRPDLFERVEVILEAPVLPQGKPYKPVPSIARWFAPFYLFAWQQQPISPANAKIFGPLDNPRKRELIMALPFNPRYGKTFVTNMKDLADWMENTGTDIYQHVKFGAILVPSKDLVLDAAAMRQSAQQAENLQIIEVEGCSHLITADRPDSIPPLPAV
ncbi:alpha/beta fold hydrolase [Pseudomonas neustonica]|uniref:alpha/beta fold hydrolase n=1 Tax=Pseudomonas TaxID=286 RepID=UPI000C94A51F|nr:alpha/beta hydrolase [Pseudomonas sp. 5Ae-yellow]MAB25880.1 alpha/beta hydrolase [Pseudomonadales bacterium]MBA6419438.1 alpha/beta hydrolase [Pseudomonas sp. 5Ae-yellow]|tara:strand:- start:1162 stop:2094 length:933 start_codon:yes stop_codon:yes gene_type:complete